jgi:REP element-mobilizing transposase RayT
MQGSCAIPPSLYSPKAKGIWYYFLTACVAQRTPLLASPTAHEILRAEWQTSATRHGWQIGRYVVMPDHVHFFACPLPTAKPLSAFLHAWKQWTAKRILAALDHPAPLWQPRTFDHVLRQRDSYAEKWTYVEQNPVRAGLVAIPAAWPYAGRIHFDLPL